MNGCQETRNPGPVSPLAGVWLLGLPGTGLLHLRGEGTSTAPQSPFHPNATTLAVSAVAGYLASPRVRPWTLLPFPQLSKNSNGCPRPTALIWMGDLKMILPLYNSEGKKAESVP